MRVTHNSNSTVRLRLLLAALLQVVRALGVTEKAIDMTNRYIELVQLLSHFSFGQAIELLRDSRWVVAVQQKIVQTKAKKYFSRWRTGVHSTRRFGKPLEGKMNFGSDLFLKPILKQETNPVANAFHKWQVAYRARRVLGCHAVETAQTAIRAWRKWLHLKLTYVGHGYRVRDSMFSPTANCATVAKFVFREWRGSAKLQRRRVRDIINDKRGALEHWRGLSTKKGNYMKLACLYDQTRHARPAFCTWLTVYTKTFVAGEHARRHYLQRRAGDALNVWREKRKRSLRMNHFLGRWRSTLDYHSRQVLNADNFYVRKLFVGALQRWRTKTVVTGTLRNSAQVMIYRHTKQSATLFLKVWREVTRWVARSSEKVRTLRANRDARLSFSRWRLWRETRQAADSLYRSRLFRNVVTAWKLRVDAVKENSNLKESSFANWRRLLQTRLRLRHYVRVKSRSQINLPRSLTWSDAFGRAGMAAVFMGWRKIAVLNRRVELHEAHKNRTLKSEVMKGWRMDANVAFYLRQYTLVVN
ncbi:hypothetical protein PSACC_01935 [Paramicrosporidium saccamoebae]|uniref:Sfi1 spindle body domain-containing protein n=1 Tax=Paramicrosporidium saccamoebae TaxID=1246581 RepID=A0A2H9TKE9_9FUNG|nr:hypothetical protein PSACC_01935 [Paramicrosporidium saccamoebae]